mmetsp:Transcript_95411/g.165705  ORF Transcript_95411/g.165705 Transcript_95411/m.165705 type:complete len:599 (+) Transcript_95411:116-1912(+)
MPVTDIRELEERRRTLAMEVENMRREREKRSGQLSMNTISVGCNGAADADIGHLKAADHSTGEGSLLDGSTFLRSKLDWSLPERGVSSVSFASGGEVSAGLTPERERPRFERLVKEVSSMDRSVMPSTSSTKAPEAEASTTLLPTSTAGLLAQTRSSLQASSLGATYGSNYGSSFSNIGVDRMCDITGSENVNSMLAAARDDRSCSGSSVAGITNEMRPQVGRLGHSDLIARARAVGKETADAIERAKAPLERLKSVQWPPSFGSTTSGANDFDTWSSKEGTFANAQSSRAAPGQCSEALTLSRPSSPRSASLQRPLSALRASSRPLMRPLSPRPSSLAQRGLRPSEQPSSPKRMTSSSQRAWSPQSQLSPRPQSSRPDLHWGVTSLHQPSRGREVCFSPRSTAYPPSPEDSEISMRADRALSVAASEKTRGELLRDLSRESSPMTRRRFADRLAGSEFAAGLRHSDLASKSAPSPASSIRSERMAILASSSSDHHRALIEDVSSTKIGMDRFSPRRAGMDSLLSGVEGIAPRGQEGTPGRLGARGGLMPTALERSSERCSTSAAPPPLPQLLSASSLSTSSLWGPRESPWSKASITY